MYSFMCELCVVSRLELRNKVNIVAESVLFLIPETWDDDKTCD